MPELRRKHPELDEVAAFGLGRLSEPDSNRIELHLADCDECRQKLEDVPDDALVCLLQAPTPQTQAVLSSPSTDTSPVTLSCQPTRVLQDIAQPVDSAPKDSGTKKTDFTIPRELEGHARYLILAPLGAGGMGTVYKAQHRMMDRIVALKIVNPLLVNASGAVERFTREVRAAAQLAHPNIVTAYDAEKVGDLQLLAMEFVDGQTLAQVLDVEHELPVAQACDYMRQTALGLQHALDRGMVHRDIKPQNLMLVAGPNAAAPQVIKILDFGLARFVSEQAQSGGATESGTLMGSADYMSPEQAEDAHSADERADIYSMGCTLYHLLAGRLPLPAVSLLRKLEAHCYDQAIPLHQVRSAVPFELAKVVQKMMAKDPARRYQTPAAVAEALLPFTQAQPATSPRYTPFVSRKAIVALAAGLLIAGLGFWAAPIVFRLQTPHGTLIVTTDDPDVQISVKLAGKEVELFFPIQKKEISLKLGEYTLELVGGKDGLKLSTNKFQIESPSDQKTVTVEFEPSKAPWGAADKRAAEYVLSIGGKVRVNDQEQDISVAADLPGESFRLTSVGSGHNKQLSDAGLAQFQDCKNLTGLALNGTQVSDAGLAYFQNCKNLNFLYLEDTQVGDAGLAHFQDLNLGVLALNRTQVSDAGLAHFKDCKKLYWLWLGETKVGDMGLAHFKGCKELRYLILSKTQVSDAGMAHLVDCKNLVQFYLEGTQVSDAGLAHFQEFENVTQLSLANTRVGDAGLAHFKNCKNMKELSLANSQVSDASLAQIKDFKMLKALTLQGTRVTAAGIAELKKVLPQCKID